MGDESIARLFAKQDEMNQKLAEIKAILQEREKACEIHRVTIADYGQRIRKLECWQSKQDGAGGLLKTWLPILFSAIALILTLRGGEKSMGKIKAIINKKRWRNYGLWAALFSLLVLWLSDCGILDAGKYQQYINALLSLLAAAGIINNPSLGTGYFDKGEDE